MRRQLFIKSHLKIACLLVLLAGWPVLNAHSAALLSYQNFDTSIIQGGGSTSQYQKPAVPLLVLAQNQAGDSSNEPMGEIVLLDTVEDGQSSLVSIESTRPVQYTAFKLLNPLRLVIDFPKMDPGNLTSRIQVDKGIISSIRPIHFEGAGVLRLEIVLNQSADYEINKPDKNKLIVRLQSSQDISGEEIAKASPPMMMNETAPSNKTVIKKEFDKKGLRGADSIMDETSEVSEDTCFPMLYGEKETISLDFQNADVRNLFRIFAEISGFNVILSPEVGGSVNIRMIDVPWNQAMEIILTNSTLGRECFGDNIVRVASKAVLQNEASALVAAKARAVSDRLSQRDSEDLVTEVVRVDNADITELVTSLTALRSARPDARITADTRTNTLILNDLRAHVDDMLNTIRILDIPTPQVLIEAKIVDISKSFVQELGIQWGLTGDVVPNKPNDVLVSGTANATSTNFLVDLRQSTNIAAGSLSGFDLLLGGLLPGLNLNLRLEALETQGKGRVLSSPKVTTADNKEARIRSGRQIPYQVTSAEGNSIEFVDAELSLTVTPHVTSENNVYLIIDATKNAADFSQLVGTVPTITTKETHTEVLVGNGDTTVLGGIYESNSTENKKEVPFLSKLPLLGFLFKSFADADTITELLVFITPTIIETN
ncbi:MAG: type IV pilus secretin PilQ [Nitrospina sp.]|jgi:type IV pilus assembly protein PilQ|nr:type IV pilus secretin PilQ [Nitrospina sp.]MBT5631217.1 type IV pilus secretin PilQ [Nitrospina sp.]